MVENKLNVKTILLVVVALGVFLYIVGGGLSGAFTKSITGEAYSSPSSAPGTFFVNSNVDEVMRLKGTGSNFAYQSFYHGDKRMGYILADNGINGNKELLITQDEANADMLRLGPNSVAGLVVANNGNVGIGITNPSAQLQVNKNTQGWVAWIENSHTGGTDSGLFIRAGQDALDTVLEIRNKADDTLLKITGDGGVAGEKFEKSVAKILSKARPENRILAPLGVDDTFLDYLGSNYVTTPNNCVNICGSVGKICISESLAIKEVPSADPTDIEIYTKTHTAGFYACNQDIPPLHDGVTPDVVSLLPKFILNCMCY